MLRHIRLIKRLARQRELYDFMVRLAEYTPGLVRQRHLDRMWKMMDETAGKIIKVSKPKKAKC